MFWYLSCIWHHSTWVEARCGGDSRDPWVSPWTWLEEKGNHWDSTKQWLWTWDTYSIQSMAVLVGVRIRIMMMMMMVMNEQMYLRVHDVQTNPSSGAKCFMIGAKVIYRWTTTQVLWCCFAENVTKNEQMWWILILPLNATSSGVCHFEWRMPLRVAYATSSGVCHFEWRATSKWRMPLRVACRTVSTPLHATSCHLKWREVAKSVCTPAVCSMLKIKKWMLFFMFITFVLQKYSKKRKSWKSLKTNHLFNSIFIFWKYIYANKKCFISSTHIFSIFKTHRNLKTFLKKNLNVK